MKLQEIPLAASYAFVSLWYAFDAFETSSELNQTWHISIMYFNLY